MNPSQPLTTPARTEPPADDALPREELSALAGLARAQARKVLKKIPLLGPVVWLLMQQSGSRHTLLSELEWRVLPALMLDQSKLYLKDDAPLAFVSWARLDEDVAQRYRVVPHQLTMTDWASGDQIWLVDVLTPFGGAQEVLKDLRENVFPGEVVHQLVPLAANPQVVVWPAVPPKPAAKP